MTVCLFNLHVLLRRPAAVVFNLVHGLVCTYAHVVLLAFLQLFDSLRCGFAARYCGSLHVLECARCAVLNLEACSLCGMLLPRNLHLAGTGSLDASHSYLGRVDLKRLGHGACICSRASNRNLRGAHILVLRTGNGVVGILHQLLT